MVIPDGNYDVIVRMLGYISLTFQLESKALKPQGYRFMLIPAEEELDAIEIEVTRDPAWYRNLNIFKDYFLGTSQNGKACELLNETSVRIDDLSEPGTLRVSSADVLKIDNPNLGYRIDYLLTDFRYQSRDKYIFYGGYPLFIPDSTLSKRKQRRVKANREKAFRGSLQHLIRAIYTGTTAEEGFVIRRLYRTEDPRTKGKFVDQVESGTISSAELVERNEDGKVLLKFQDHLHIAYTNERESAEFRGSASSGPAGNQFSIMHLEADSVEIFQNGNYSDPFAILVEGYIAWERVGDLLPLDYQPDLE